MTLTFLSGLDAGDALDFVEGVSPPLKVGEAPLVLPAVREDGNGGLVEGTRPAMDRHCGADAQPGEVLRTRRKGAKFRGGREQSSGEEGSKFQMPHKGSRPNRNGVLP